MSVTDPSGKPPADSGLVIDPPPMRGTVANIGGQPTTVPYACVVGISDEILDEIATRVAAKLNPQPPPVASAAQDPNLPAEVPAAA